MDFRNVLIAIILSTLVLVGWSMFFEAPIIEQPESEKQITKKLLLGEGTKITL